MVQQESAIAISRIDDSERLRPVDPDHVELIASSISERGLLTPIRVRDAGVGEYVLIAGAHRLAALKALKWTELTVGVHVIIADVGGLEARIDEIDENLARHELNALDRAVFLAERKKLYLAVHAEAARGGDRKSQKFLEKIKGQRLPFDSSFSSQTAKRIGISRRTIDLAIQLVEKLDAEAIAALRGTSLETNQKELFALSALDPEKQRAVANSIKRGDAKSFAGAQLHLGFIESPGASDPQARLYAVWLDAWTKMDKVTRAQALAAAGLIYKPTDAAAKGSRK